MDVRPQGLLLDCPSSAKREKRRSEGTTRPETRKRDKPSSTAARLGWGPERRGLGGLGLRETGKRAAGWECQWRNPLRGKSGD